MVIQRCKDVLLEKVSEGLKKLATCYLQMPSTYYSSDWETKCWPMEWILLLQWRSRDVLSEFSGYYCLRLLLDIESPLATYFIDLFRQLEWLLETMLPRLRESPTFADKLLNEAINPLLDSIKPAANSCRYLFAISRLSPTAFSRWLSTGKEMKREGKAYRDFSLDGFRSLTKMLSFVNLDRCSNRNLVKLGKKLGSGGYGVVYEGYFVTSKDGDQSQRIAAEPVAVKVFNNESVGPSRSAGSQFFEQMEKMQELQRMKKDGHNTSSMTAEEVSLLEELWKLVSAKHPNIVTARGYIGNRPEGESGLVMELMSTSLQEYLGKKVGEPLEEVEMIDLMLEIAKGMSFLHECGLVHKDLKPGNILLRSHKKLGRWGKYPAMEVKLADFGLTQHFVQDVQQSAVDMTPTGTYCYMAPEVLHIADYKASYQDKVDVFSYGTTCFNILTCEYPGALEFTSPHYKDEFYKAVKSNDWRKAVEGKPEYLIDLIARCWDCDPSRRPTFATICSLLQRAMLCIFSPPVINVTALSDFRQNSMHSLLNMYKIFASSNLGSFARLFRLRGMSPEELRRDINVRLIGTPMMESCLKEFRRDILDAIVRGDLRSNLREDADLLLEAVSSEELFSAIDEANVRDGSNSFTAPFIRVEVQEPTARFFRIPLKTMEPEWIVFKALVCSSMLTRLLKHEGGALSDYEVDPLQLFPFKLDNALSDLEVDESLIPFLICFWEGCIGTEISL